MSIMSFRDRPVRRSAVLALTTLLARPSFDQLPIHTEERKFSLLSVFPQFSPSVLRTNWKLSAGTLKVRIDDPYIIPSPPGNSKSPDEGDERLRTLPDHLEDAKTPSSS
jgi:hypothetical protein